MSILSSIGKAGKGVVGLFTGGGSATAAQTATDNAAAQQAADAPPPPPRTPAPTPVYTIGAPAAAAPAAPTAPARPVVPAGTPVTRLPTGGSAALVPSSNLVPRDQGTVSTAINNATNPVATVGATGGSTGPGGAYQLTPSSTVSGPVVAPLPAGRLMNKVGSKYVAERYGSQYQLGGDENFTGELTAAMQANAAANSANLIGTGNAAANVGSQAQQTLDSIGGQAQKNSGAAAFDVTGDANLLGFNGMNYTRQGDDVQGRGAPTLDTAQQNDSLGQSLGQADALSQAGAGAYSLSADATGRTAPALNVGQQDATLEQANLLSTALGASGAQAQQLGLSADGRAAPQAQLAGANAAINAARGNAGTVGAIGDQALALSQDAAGRTAIAPANYGAAQSMIGQGVDSSMSAQQTGQALTGLEATQGPSAAQAQLAQSQAAAAAQAMSLARSGRGWGGSAQGLADAQRAQAAGLMTANNQAAQLRASEDAAWRQRQAQNLSSGAQIANQSGALQVQAGQQLGQQAQADQAAALQSRAQNDQLQSQLYGYGLQGAQSAGQLNAATGQQLSQNAIQQAQIDQQTTAQNDARLAQMTGLGMQGQQQAATLQQSEAAQYAQQAALNQQASLQQTQLNDARSAQMYGMGMQGQQQAAALQQAAAAQYGDQATQNLQAGLQQTQLNDQFATSLYGASNAAMQGDIQGKLSAGQLALAGTQANGDLTGAGATAALAGLSQQQQAALASSQIENGALMQTGQLAQVQNQLQQNQIGDYLQEEGIDAGVATASRGQTMQLIGAGLAAVGSAAGAMSDVRAKKNIMPDLKPLDRKKSYEELKSELSEGDSLLNPKPPGGGKNPFTLQDTENEYALGGYAPNGVNPGRGSGVMGPGGPAYDKAMDMASKAKAQEADDGNKPLKALAGATQAFGNSMQGAPGGMPNFSQPARPRFGLQPLQLTSDVRSKTDVRSDGPSANETTQLTPDQEAKFQDWAKRNRITDVDHPDSHYDYRGYYQQYGNEPHQRGTHFTDEFKQHGHPTFSNESNYSKAFDDGGYWEGEKFNKSARPDTSNTFDLDALDDAYRRQQQTSDVRSKTAIKGDGPKPDRRAELEEMRAAIRDLGAQAGNNMPERFAPPSGEILESAKNTPSYSYDYKDPAAVGAAPGRQFGPMAQELKQQPATSSLVRPGPDGKLRVDGARLGMTAYSGLGQLARKQEGDYDDLRKRINALGQART